MLTPGKMSPKSELVSARCSNFTFYSTESKDEHKIYAAHIAPFNVGSTNLRYLPIRTKGAAIWIPPFHPGNVLVALLHSGSAGDA
jgi:hypothetical protein